MKLTLYGASQIVTHSGKPYVNFLRGVLAGLWLALLALIIERFAL